MEGSSESGWQRSYSSRGLNSSFLDTNPRPPRSNTNTVRFSDDTLKSHDSIERCVQKNISLHHSNSNSNTTCTPQLESNLRQWLDNPERAVDAIDCLHIFSQVVEIVNLAHSKGIIVHCVRPSSFVISSLNQLSFIESSSSSHSESNCQMGDSLGVVDSQETTGDNNNNIGGNKIHSFPMKQILARESNWYSPPEAFSGAAPTCASDIYQLGVLLFELYCEFGSTGEKSRNMANLKHRVLPPQLLRKWPKEASFCLWLLHHDPSHRPKMSELLKSEFLNEPRIENEEREAAIELHEQIVEQELLLEFFITLRQRKQDAADSLSKTISFISSDIEEVTKLQAALGFKGRSNPELTKNTSLINPDDGTSDSTILGLRKRDVLGLEPDKDEEPEISSSVGKESAFSKSSRLMKNFRKVESAYFLARDVNSADKNSVMCSEKSCVSDQAAKEVDNSEKGNGWINKFMGGLCKYLAFSKLKVKADLRQGGLFNSSNLVCSLGFDRDGEFFATAGVNKKIKVFEYNSIVGENRDIHYPVVELDGGSKLSSICWNGYVKGQIASSNFEGVVQVWNVGRSRAFMEMREHERRVWSIDFSAADPALLASGSDDGSVKLWNINQGGSISTIRAKANVCSVQFPPNLSRTLAFGSADNKIYYYDLRRSKVPLCTLVGHSKTVSYVKFVDSTTLVSASTDNTLKLWDLSACTSRILDCPLQSYTGHLNLRNFVGLSVSQGYIATGSETNEAFLISLHILICDKLQVFVYHKDFPMPSLSFKFNSRDPFYADNTAQFISSVCWRGQTSTLVAANSSGNVKVLEMS